MTDCHDWFAEVAETLVRYVVAKAGFEVFGQSEWGADLAIQERSLRRWIRCEVRSSDCSTNPQQKSAAKLAEIAELEACVCLTGATTFQIGFFKLNSRGCREVEFAGGPAIRHIYVSPEALSQWLHCHYFQSDGTI